MRSWAAFSLVEISLAFTILILAMLPMMNLFVGTSKLSNKTTGVFREAVAGQLVWESIKGKSIIDPRFLRDLTSQYGFAGAEIDHPLHSGRRVIALVHTGGFVERDGPLDAAGNPLPLTPFATHLVNRTGGDLNADENRASFASGGSGVGQADLASLARNYQDLAVRVTFTDALVPEWKPGEPRINTTLVSTELLKDVFVQVFRIGPDHKVVGEPALSLHTQLNTPAESLTRSSLENLRRSQDTWDYPAALKEAYSAVFETAEELRMGNEMRRVASDLLIVVMEAVGEGVLSQGDDLGFGLTGANGRPTDYWVRELLSNPTITRKQVAADLLAEKARNIHNAYRHSMKSMSIIGDYGPRFGLRLRSIVRFLEVQLALARRGGDSVARSNVVRLALSRPRTILEAGFWSGLMSQDKWWKAISRPLDWPRRYLEAISQAQALCVTIDADPKATPVDRVRAINLYVELTRAQKLFLGLARLREEDFIETKVTEYTAPMAAYAQALRGDEVFDLTALRQRNQAMATVLSSLKSDLEPGLPYPKALENLSPQGYIGERIDTIRDAFNYFNLTDGARLVSGGLRQLVRQVRDGVPPPPDAAQFDPPEEPVPDAPGP